MKKYSWKDLIGENNVCGGGHLAAVVFCCSLEKPCIWRTMALKKLGISEDEYRKVKEDLKIESEYVCFGNLAYCCSVEKPCPNRDKALKALGWTTSQYLQYKYRILQHLIPEDLMDKAFTERVVAYYGIQLLDMDEQRLYRGIAMGSVEARLIYLLDVSVDGQDLDPKLSEAFSATEFIGVRVPKEVAKAIEELVERGEATSKSDVVRRALLMYLTFARKKMEADEQR